MANLRDLRNRIKSVENIKKITSTMEMVATAKAKKARDSFHNASFYNKTINSFLADILGSSYNYPAIHEGMRYLQSPQAATKVGQILITSDRGLCGGFNSQLLEWAKKKRNVYLKQGIKEFSLYNFGKKAFIYCRNKELPTLESEVDYEAKILQSSKQIADAVCEQFLAGDNQHVEIVYQKFISAGLQKPVAETILPLDIEAIKNMVLQGGGDDIISDDGQPKLKTVFELEPDVDRVLENLIPEFIQNQIYMAVLSNKASEHLARRVAMKQATDSAGDMLKDLNKTYNRRRQAKITGDLIEIISAAKAIK